MTERKANERRNWKGVLFPYDIFIPDDSPECQYCLTDKQAMLIRGLLEPVGWETRWWSDTTDIDKDTIEAFRDDMIRRLMMACCNGDFPLIYQWTVDGVLQVSDDGGATFTDAPEQDPRNSSTTYPPVPTDAAPDIKCAGATGAVNIIKAQVGDNITDDMTHTSLQELIQTWVSTIIQTTNPFLALINIGVNLIFTLLASSLHDALTDDVYHKLVCILKCDMAADLSFNQSQWEQVRSDILDQISGIAGVFLEHLVFLLGRVGITNLVRSQNTTEGDCSDCCPTCSSLWVVYAGRSETIDLVTDTYIECTAALAGGNYYVILHTPTVDDCCVVSNIEALTGTIDQTGNLSWSTCHYARTEGAPEHAFGLYGFVDPINYIQLQSSVPFTVRITFA